VTHQGKRAYLQRSSDKTERGSNDISDKTKVKTIPAKETIYFSLLEIVYLYFTFSLK